ncbi:synaptobrevin-domain-containing protein [Schizophyllum commune]
MSLITACVAQGTNIIAQHQTDTSRGNFSQATQTILEKIPPNDSKLTYVWSTYLFHYISEAGYTYLVMADDSAGRRMPFGFLGAVKNHFLEDPEAFTSSTLAKLMHEFNTAPPQDELARAQNELQSVKDIMVQNVEQILSRGERIELLVDKTDHMAGQATAFRRGARTVRRQMWWRNTRVVALGVVVGVILVWVFMAQFCGAGLNQCGRKKHVEAPPSGGGEGGK